MQAFDRLAAVGWLSRILAPANRAGQIAGTFLVNMLTFRWPVLLLLSWMAQTGGDVLRQFLGRSKLDLALDSERLRDPTPLGKVFGVVQRRFFHPRSRQTAFELGVGQLAGVHHLPRMPLDRLSVRQANRLRSLMPTADRRADSEFSARFLLGWPVLEICR